MIERNRNHQNRLKNTMNWQIYIQQFKNYLSLERGFSENSIEAYLRDVEKFREFAQSKEQNKPEKISTDFIQEFLKYLNELGIAETSQARILSGIKSFYKFLFLENSISTDPSYLIEAPKLARKLPDTLSYEEIEQLLTAIDLSTAEGTRNRAILEVLYSCGLRVSELTELKLSQLYFDIGFVKVIGKGNKERFVPIGKDAIKYTTQYLQHYRNHIEIPKGYENYVFLNRRGKNLSRVYIFMIIKDLAANIGLKKNISPHTFRHSFATHLLEGGANLRAIQEMLGHESITTTEIYTHLDKDYLRQTILQFHPRS